MVITSALHAEGRQFEPGTDQILVCKAFAFAALFVVFLGPITWQNEPHTSYIKIYFGSVPISMGKFSREIHRFCFHVLPNGASTCCIMVPYWFPPKHGHFSPVSGWPSGLRRQTQGSALSLDQGLQRRFLVLLWGRGFESHFWQQIFCNIIRRKTPIFKNLIVSIRLTFFICRFGFGWTKTRYNHLFARLEYSSAHDHLQRCHIFFVLFLVDWQVPFNLVDQLLSQGCAEETWWRAQLSCLRSAVGSASVS